MSSYEENHRWAYAAILHVMSKLTLGSPNNLGAAAARQMLTPLFPVSQIQGFVTMAQGQIAKQVLNGVRKRDTEFQRKLFSSGKFGGSEYKELCWAETARSAVEAGVGNCAEQTAIAFMYLRDKGKFPIDFVQWGNVVGGIGGHAFAILGRPGKSNIEDPDTWGRDCAVCDPHQEHIAFPAYMVDHYFGSKKFELVFRMEQRSSVTTPVQD